MATNIQQSGEMVKQKVPKYAHKRNPILTVGKYDDGEKGIRGRGLSLDEINQKIYIADWHNSRVQVLSYEGDFLTKFGGEVLRRPWGISVTEDHVFVTDNSSCTLFQFCKSSHQLLNRAGGKGGNEGQLMDPEGLCVDSNGDVFVADCVNLRISVFTKLLEYKQAIGKGSLLYPNDVKLTTDKVIVLDNSDNCVHFFSRSGDLLTSFVSQRGGPECLVSEPNFFCLDCDENIIISDRFHHEIKILSESGDVLHIIGLKKSDKGDFALPYGVAISSSGIIFVCSDNPDHALQLF